MDAAANISGFALHQSKIEVPDEVREMDARLNTLVPDEVRETGARLSTLDDDDTRLMLRLTVRDTDANDGEVRSWCKWGGGIETTTEGCVARPAVNNISLKVRVTCEALLLFDDDDEDDNEAEAEAGTPNAEDDDNSYDECESNE